MSPFEPAYLPEDSFTIEGNMARFKCSAQVAEDMVKFNREQSVFLNDTYQVNVHDSHPYLLHLSIKRRDKQPIHDWRDLQAIKNELIGPEHEAVELYPAESRLTDTANQYHLWVLKTEGERFPFGFNDGRNLLDPAQAAEVGAVQRAFKE